MTALLELKEITKSFGGVRALRGATFAIQAGEVHALLGENGAGKSTLMRVVGGEIPPDSGEMLIDGKPAHLRSPREAAARGIGIIHQELALAPDLTVAENIFLREIPSFISWPALKTRAKALLDRLGFDNIPPGATVSSLTLAHQQVVEIAKALSWQAKVIVFDEPTAVLSAHDAERLHRVIAGLRAHNVGIVYISHRLEEVFQVADRITVMKDGVCLASVLPHESSISDVIRMMVGRPMSQLFPQKPRRTIGAEILRADGLYAGSRVRNVSLSLKAGEIVGLGGLVGSGRTEVARLLFGADRLDQGQITLRGKPIKLRSPPDAVSAGIGLVPEDRKHQGVILDTPIRINATLARLAPVATPVIGYIKLATERRIVTDLGEALRLKAPSIEAPASSLSGGNQQKVVLAKWFHAGGDVILLDEPTRGVDVGAKLEIYSLIFKLAAAGKAVLVISCEHQELFGLCDRVLVMGEGELRGELLPDAYSEENLLSAAMIKQADTKYEGANP
jgi:ribose transport system ATP-binding protein